MTNKLNILNKYWNYTSFRPGQEAIIDSILNKEETLAIMPTGGGKSICYQVPALLFDGLCIVVSPLIALMKDQVEQLKARGINAVAIYSGLHKKEIDQILDRAIYGDINLLYVSPERLMTELFLVRAKQMNISLLAIDEAHCISKWGHDFRPAYLKIAEFKNELSISNVAAFTATATKVVRKDIIEHLEIKDPKEFIYSFARNNLSLKVLNKENKDQEVLRQVNKFNESIIIYTTSRKKTEQLAYTLNSNKVDATFYHAGLSHEERIKRQNDWVNNKVKVIVATNAFGMGIDKANVRLVLHYNIPENIEAYYQEAGRAGRDGQLSEAVLLANNLDLENLLSNLKIRFPDKTFLRLIYQSLCNYYQLAFGTEGIVTVDFNFYDFVSSRNLPFKETHYAIKLLESQGILQLSSDYYSPSRLMLKLSNRVLYDFQVANEKYDLLLKTILRTYGGETFNSLITISETELAKHLKVSINKVKTDLEYLNNLSVISYYPQKNVPQLSFLERRFDPKYLPLASQELEEQKERAAKALNKMIAYVKNDRICRMNFIQSYFDEEGVKPCGLCNICVDPEVTLKDIIEFLPCSIEAISSLPNSKKLGELIRKLIINQKIELVSGKLFLKT